MKTHRHCTNCGVLKPFTEFHKMKRGKCGHASVCKSCKSLKKKISKKKLKNKKTVDEFLQLFLRELERVN